MADLTRLHYELIRSLLEEGVCPGNAELGRRMGINAGAVEELLRGLAAIHGIVLHPHACEPWVVHPFSLTPTINWIEGKSRGWWAPCIWCAFGAASLVGGEVRIHTRYGAESEPLTIPVVDGMPAGGGDVWVHFAIPPARAWDNVHQHCAMVLPFRGREEIESWCERYRIPFGQAVSLEQVARLAHLWYGPYADANWHKWTVAEAQEIFDRAGLRGEFWRLGSRTGQF